MALELSYEESDGTVREFDPDVLSREAWEFHMDATENPVERGAAVTDHVRHKEETLNVEVVISNTPTRVPRSHTGGVGGEFRSTGNGGSVLTFDSFFDRVGLVVEDLQRVAERALKWTVVTDVKDHVGMVLLGVHAEKDRPTESVKINLSFRKLFVVSTRLVAVPQRVRRTRPRVPQGTQPTRPAREGLAHRALRALGS